MGDSYQGASQHPGDIQVLCSWQYTCPEEQERWLVVSGGSYREIKANPPFGYTPRYHKFYCHNPNDNTTQHNLNTIVGFDMKITVQTPPPHKLNSSLHEPQSSIHCWKLNIMWSATTRRARTITRTRTTTTTTATSATTPPTTTATPTTTTPPTTTATTTTTQQH